jgi:polyisoprenyl-teichoic acid--peptidoglycan teichoic acid transferase
MPAVAAPASVVTTPPLGLSITATWMLYLAGCALVVFLVVAVLPPLLLRGRPHRTWFQRSLLALNVSLVLTALVAATGLTWFRDQFGELPRQEFAAGVLAEVGEQGEPRNILLVGIDSSDGLDSDDTVTIGRDPGSDLADTIMVLRIVPETEEAHLVSFNRDIWLPIAGTGGNNRINTALQAGGPEGLIQTLRQNFDIEIHHYVQVNFRGFQDLVRILGGVPMYFPEPVRSHDTGLWVNVPPGGACVTLDPEQSLAFVRVRSDYATYRDGRWRQDDPTGDLGRTRRQQLFVQLALAQAVDRGARNPSTLEQFLRVGQEHVVVDDEILIGELLDLGTQFSDFSADSLFSYQLPLRNGSVGGASVEFLIEEQAQPILDVFRGTAGSLVSPAAVRVSVRNGSGTSGEATLVSEALRSITPQGFTVVSAADAASFDYERTVIRHTPGNEVLAAFLARFLDRNPVIEEAEGLGDAALELVTGHDFGGIRDEPRPEEAVAALLPATTTTTSAPGPASAEPPGDGPAPTTTSTTVVGVIPEQPPGIDC